MVDATVSKTVDSQGREGSSPSPGTTDVAWQPNCQAVLVCPLFHTVFPVFVAGFLLLHAGCPLMPDNHHARLLELSGIFL